MKTYIAASNRLWTAPRRISLLSFMTMSKATLIPPSGSLADAVADDTEEEARFSFQKAPATIPPAARKTIQISKGPEMPRAEAARDAILPARTATRASPVYA